jgi:tRNA splicing endonuclease
MQDKRQKKSTDYTDEHRLKDKKIDSYVEYRLLRNHGLIVKSYWLLVIDVTY